MASIAKKIPTALKYNCNQVIYILPGNPTPLARARLSGRRFFDQQKLLKINHGIILDRIHNEMPLYTGPLEVNATFYLPFQSGASQKLKNKMIGKFRPLRPDLDNYIKYILDVSNKILFHDDSIVVVIHAQKIYDSIPRTEFTITEIR